MTSLKTLKNKKVTVYTVVDAGSEDAARKVVFEGYFDKIEGYFLYLKMSAAKNSPIVGIINTNYIMAVQVVSNFMGDLDASSREFN